MSETINFPNGKPGGGADKPAGEPIQLPPVLDVVTPTGAKICPFMAPQILMMPVITKGSGLVTPGQQQQSAFVRQFAPCVQAACMAWGRPMTNGGEGFCRLVEK